MDKSILTNRIKAKAKSLGFMSSGISKAGFLENEALILENWLNNNYHGEMAYMANHFDKRLDPRILVDGAKSVISVLLNYFPEQDLFKDQPLKLSKYAYGTDYHFVLKDKLKDLVKFIIDEVGEVNARVFTDSAPVLDKAWAEKSGLGWQGKNGMLISKQNGSFFFVGEIILDLDLDYDIPSNANYCGTCTKCIDSCPTNAIVSPNEVDGSKCISYLTIELKDQLIPSEFENKMDGWFFGCDVCQDVCPWNRFSKPNTHPEFSPHSNLKNTEWTELTQDIFNDLFKLSAIKRTKFKGLDRNINFIKKSNKTD